MYSIVFAIVLFLKNCLHNKVWKNMDISLCSFQENQPKQSITKILKLDNIKD